MAIQQAHITTQREVAIQDFDTAQIYTVPEKFKLSCMTVDLYNVHAFCRAKAEPAMPVCTVLPSSQDATRPFRCQHISTVRKIATEQACVRAAPEGQQKVSKSACRARQCHGRRLCGVPMPNALWEPGPRSVSSAY